MEINRYVEIVKDVYNRPNNEGLIIHERFDSQSSDKPPNTNYFSSIYRTQKWIWITNARDGLELNIKYR